MVMNTKICSICKNEKDRSDFTKHPTTKDRLQAECKQCKSAYTTEYQRKKSCGIDAYGYQIMLEHQESRCAICGVHVDDCKRALAIDHDHETGFARGLLCCSCNMGLGYFKDDVDKLRDAAWYLEEFTITS